MKRYDFLLKSLAYNFFIDTILIRKEIKEKKDSIDLHQTPEKNHLDNMLLMKKTNRILLFSVIIFSILFSYSLSGFGKDEKIKVAFIWNGDDDDSPKSKSIQYCLSHIRQAKTINLNEKKYQLIYKIPDTLESEDKLVESLWRSEVDLFVLLKTDLINENLIDLTVIDCKLGLPIFHEKLPYLEDEQAAFCLNLLGDIHHAIILKNEGIKSFVFFDPPELNVEHFDQVYFQRACYFLVDQVLKRSYRFAVLPEEFRERFFTHPAVMEGFDIPIKVVSFSSLKIEKNVPFNFMTIKQLDRFRNVIEESEHLVSKKHLREFIFYQMPRLFDVLFGADEGRSVTRLNNVVNAYAQIGAYDFSTAIRESLILLEPQEPVDRRLIIKEYRGWMNQFFPSVIRNGIWEFDDPDILPEIYFRVGGYIRLVELAKYILDIEHLTLKEQAHIAWGTAAEILQYRIPYYIFEGKRHGEDLLKWAEAAEEDFLLNYYPPQWVNQITNNWHEKLISATISRIDRPFSTPHDLDFIYIILTTVVPDHWETSASLGQWMNYAWKGHGPLKNTFTSEEYTSFLFRLMNSGHEVAALYGGYGYVMQQWADGNIHNKEDIIELKGFTEELMERYRKTPYLTGIRYSRKGERLYSGLSHTLKDLENKIGLSD